MINCDDRILVGFSGGADSTALLHYLSLRHNKASLFALHVNHNIRGAEAIRDSEFCRSFASSLGINFYVENIDAPRLAKESGRSVEEASRDARYSLFVRYAEKLGCNKIALAHNYCDNSETFLINLTRGSGPSGLCGIPAVRPAGSLLIIRPFIKTERKEIEDYCRENCLSFVTDSSNSGDEYIRNRIRHSVMPVLSEINPLINEHISRAGGLIKKDIDYLNTLALSEYSSRADGNRLETKDLFTLPDPISSRVLILFLESAGAAVSYRRLSDLTAIIRSRSPSARLYIGNGCIAEMQYSLLCIVSSDSHAFFEPFPLNVPMEKELPEAGLIVKTSYSKKESFSEASGSSIFIDPDKFVSAPVFRSRKQGDMFAGKEGTKSIKKLMIDKKIPRYERELIPLLDDGGRIAAGYILGTSLCYRISAETSKILRIDFINTRDIFWPSVSHSQDGYKECL